MSNNTPWYRWQNGDLLLDLQVQPGARDDAFAGPYGDRLRLRIAGPPVDGRANQRLQRFLGQAFGVAPGRVELRRGLASRRKQVLIRQPAVLPEALAIGPASDS
ncbi:MAG: DUF167 family protein [Gammaproteobacteria bacterium]|jgi:hypothetical protein|nr:DUF167 family protein [Gammaproteobacteria bacterium]